MTLDRARMADLINRLLNADSEAESDRLSDEIGRLSPDPKWSDYIFYSNLHGIADGPLDVEAVLDKIEAYRPIILGYRPPEG